MVTDIFVNEKCQKDLLYVVCTILLGYVHILVNQCGHMYEDCNVSKQEHRQRRQDAEGQSNTLQALL
jgi:hypothetical protein